ncbi:unnamed protein product [Effrenium voratum]|nr:unnamed protein product [Effrenium voratum]
MSAPTDADVHGNTIPSKPTLSSEAPSLDPKGASEDGQDVKVGSASDDAAAWAPRPVKQRRSGLCGWFQELYAHFGMFVPLTVLVYGVNQSVSASIGSFALRFYMQDVLGLDGATMGRLKTAGSLPWNLKPLIGMISDAMPLCGYHRRSYMILAACFGIFGYILLGIMALPGLALVGALVAINFAISTSDVIVDSKGAELSRDQPRYASDLQSLMWGTAAFFSIVASGIQGVLVQWFTPQKVFLGLSFLPVVGALLPAARGWLAEPRRPCKLQLGVFRQHPQVTALAFFISLQSLMLSMVQVLVSDAWVRAAITAAAGLAVTITSFWALNRITPYLGRTALFICLRFFLQPGLGEAMFVWSTKSPDGPRLQAWQLGFVDCFGALGLLLGVVLYNRHLTGCSYRRIFLVIQLTFFFSQLLEVLLVLRWNRALGIPDIFFLVGDDTFALMASRMFSVVFSVLASKVCPVNLEATLFAVLMAIANFGWAVSNFLGVALCEAWGLVDGNFDQLPEAVLTKALTRLLPIPLILLTPTFTPQDPVPTNLKPEVEESQEMMEEEKA